MLIGIPKEIKNHEYRVGATPAIVRALVDAGHRVLVEKKAGERIGFSDEMYQKTGAEMVATAAEVYAAEMIIKVKEPQQGEFALLRENQVVFSYLHLAPDPAQTRQLVKSGVIAIAYETVTDYLGRLPLLIPMSEIAGRTSIQVGAVCLQMNNGGRGLLLGGVPGVPPAKVVIVGGGVVGTEAARMALGMGADVTIMDRDLARLRTLDSLLGPRLKTLYSTSSALEDVIPQADLIVGSVLIPGKRAPKLITRDMLKKMEPSSVLVDVAIDQGGCAETSRPTTHEHPTYVEEGVIHYCVTNIPGACARTATIALTNATMDYVMLLANKGVVKALKEHAGLRDGLNVCRGAVTHPSVAADLGYTYVSPSRALGF